MRRKNKQTQRQVLQIKALVRSRDGMACVKCGMTNARHRVERGCQLNVHRVTPGSLYALDETCITVCYECHVRCHGGTAGPYIRYPRATPGDNILHLMQNKKLTVEMVAERSGLTSEDVDVTIHGEIAHVDLGTIGRICEAIGMSTRSAIDAICLEKIEQIQSMKERQKNIS
jgi:DNA-binding Xre family transcriptional regulator